MLPQIVGSHSMALAAVGACHGIASLASPSEQPIVKAVTVAAGRRLAGGVNKKESLLCEYVRKWTQLFVLNGMPSGNSDDCDSSSNGDLWVLLLRSPEQDICEFHSILRYSHGNFWSLEKRTSTRCAIKWRSQQYLTACLA